MNIIEKKIIIPKSEEHIIDALLIDPKNEDEWVGDGTLYTVTAEFEDGCSMDIQICGVCGYEEGGCNKAWTQAVLFNSNWCEIGCSDVGEDFYGWWNVDNGDTRYIVVVEKEGENA